MIEATADNSGHTAPLRSPKFRLRRNFVYAGNVIRNQTSAGKI